MRNGEAHFIDCSVQQTRGMSPGFRPCPFSILSLGPFHASQSCFHFFRINTSRAEFAVLNLKKSPAVLRTLHVCPDNEAQQTSQVSGGNTVPVCFFFFLSGVQESKRRMKRPMRWDVSCGGIFLHMVVQSTYRPPTVDERRHTLRAAATGIIGIRSGHDTPRAGRFTFGGLAFRLSVATMRAVATSS